MLEGVLVLAPPWRSARAAACQTSYGIARGVPPRPRSASRAAHRRHRPRPEHLADHRRVVQQRLLDRRQRIEPGRDQRVDCLRDGDVLGERRGPVTEGDVRGRTASARTPPRTAGCLSARSMMADRRLGGQRRAAPAASRAACRVRPRSAAPGRSVIALRACRRPTPARRSSSSGRAVADDEQRHPLGLLGQVLDERQQRVVGPLQVLEDQHRGPRSASLSKNRRQAVKFSFRRGLAAPPSPTSGRRRCRIQCARRGPSAGPRLELRSTASSGGSESRMPARP